jgi:hypothetical protein
VRVTSNDADSIQIRDEQLRMRENTRPLKEWVCTIVSTRYVVVSARDEDKARQHAERLAKGGLGRSVKITEIEEVLDTD